MAKKKISKKKLNQVKGGLNYPIANGTPMGCGFLTTPDKSLPITHLSNETKKGNSEEDLKSFTPERL